MSDDFPGLAFYNQDGVILRSAPQDDAHFAEVSVTLLDLSRADQLLVSIAGLHMAFTEDLGIDFVFSSFTLRRCVLVADRLDIPTERRLIDAVVGIRGRMGLVRRLADEHFYVDGNGGPLHTSDDPSLEPYRVTDGFGQAFVDAFSREYRATTPAPSGD